MRKYVETIKHVSLFSQLSDNELESISKISHANTFGKGHVVCQEGEEGDALYIIMKGKVKVCLYDENGREYILDVIGEGGFFGEMSLIDELPRSANVITLDPSELLVVKRQEFVRVLMENPSATLGILKVLSRRLRAADEKIKGLAFYSVEGRILKYLMDVGNSSGIRVKDYIVIERGPTQVEIANSCGCSRETVSRMIKHLIGKGVITVRKKLYTLNLAKLPI
jgi:CRP/FNR family transcriptional regulator, cyclic AMP receptor protein